MRIRAGGFEGLMTPGSTIAAGVFRELLLPRTDAGVLTEVILVALIGGVAFWLARHDRELRIFVAGCVVFTYAFFGLRAVH